MAFTGQLRQNEIFAALYNMIISQQVFADNIKGTYSALVDRARVDGTLYGDTKLYYATDSLESFDWLNDAEAGNLLELHRPEAPKVQAIYMDVFRQIRLTVDDYLSKRAFATEGAFSDFNSVMLGWIRATKRIYDSTLYNAYIGTTRTNIGKQVQNVAVPAETKTEGVFGLTIAEKLADLLVELKDVTRDYNDYGYIRSYDESDLLVVWNADVYNAIKKLDLPTIFHTEGLLSEFKQEVLPSRYFGQVVGESGTATTSESNVSVRSLIEKTYPLAGIENGASNETAAKAKDHRAKMDKNGTWYVHVFAGDLLPDGVIYNQNEAYNEATDIAFKVIHKRSVPYMSAFEVGTSFYNPRSLTDNRYLTFGHNTLDYLKNYPMITVTYTLQEA